MRLKKLSTLLFSFFYLFVLLNSFSLAQQKESLLFSNKFLSFKKKIKIPVVILDPGHGGEDFGAISESGVNEKDVVLDIVHKVRRYLESIGFNVVLTRTDDRFISLGMRTRLIPKHEADLFVSIHANGAHNKEATGYETFFLSPNRFSNGIEKYRGGFNYFRLNSRAKKSLKLSKMIHEEFLLNLETENRGIKMAHFQVLRESTVPAVLIETGFLSNKKEAKALAKSQYRNKLALLIAMSIQRYSGW